MTWMGEPSGKGLRRYPDHTKEVAQVDWQKIANELEDDRERLGAMIARVEAVLADPKVHAESIRDKVRAALSDPTTRHHADQREEWRP